MFQIFAYDFTSVKIGSKDVSFLQTKFHWIWQAIAWQIICEPEAIGAAIPKDSDCNSEWHLEFAKVQMRVAQLPGLWVSCCTVRQADGNISEAEATLLPVDGSKILQGRQSPRDSQATKVSKGQPGQRVFKGDKIQGDCAPRYSPTDIPQCPACVHLTHSPPFTFKQRTEKHWLIQKH